MEKENYKKGLLNATKRAIQFVEKKIQESKERNPKPNSTAQIHNGGRLKAYGEVLNYLKSKEEKINSK